MESYKHRFEGDEAALKHDLQVHGSILPVAQKYKDKVKSLAPFSLYCRRLMNDDNFPLAPRFTHNSIQELAVHIVSAIIEKIQVQQNEITHLRARLDMESSKQSEHEREVSEVGFNLLGILEQLKVS